MFLGTRYTSAICVTALLALIMYGLSGCGGSMPNANDVDMGSRS